MGKEIITQTISKSTAKYVKSMLLFNDFYNSLIDATNELYGEKQGNEIIEKHAPVLLQAEDVARKLLTDSIIETINDKSRNQF